MRLPSNATMSGVVSVDRKT